MAVNDKKVFLYVGKKGEEGGSVYPTYTDAQIKAFNADEFVLTGSNYYHCLKSKAAMDQYIADLLKLAKQVIRCTGKFIWLGIPRPPKPTKTITLTEYEGYANDYLTKFIGPMRDKLKELKTASGYDYYYTYVQGFYMNDEHVRRKNTTYEYRHPVTGELTKEDDENGFDTVVTNLLSHPQIKMYSMISDALKTSAYGWKKLLWVPYAGFGRNYDTTFIDIAYIANTTDIFDTVLLQPGVYEKHDPDDSTTFSILDNLDVIRNSMNMQEVRSRDDNSTDKRVVAKRSSTKIGCQMEADEKMFTIKRFFDNYNFSFNALNSIKVTKPANRHFSFYWGDNTTFMDRLTKEVINYFFNQL